jgi:predicted dehydrogenase
MGELRVGVAGVGSLGYHHARILSTMTGIRCSGVHDTNGKRLADVAAEFGCAAHAELDVLIEASDAIIIAVPTIAHEAVAVAALERGVHVLIEKPIAASLDAADRILSAARQSGALVQIGHVERFNAALRACEPYLEEPLFVESHRLAPFGPRGTDVAVVLDLMIHDLDLVLSLMKRPVTAVSAVGVPVLTPSVDIANARLEFEGGGVANLTASRVSLERMRKIRFFQRSGYISLDLAAGRGEYLRLRPGAMAAYAGLVIGEGGGLSAGQPGGAVRPDARVAGGAAAEGTLSLAGLRIENLVERIQFEGDGGEPLRREQESFIAAVRGEASVPVTGDDGRRALAAALEIVERIGRHVSV